MGLNSESVLDRAFWRLAEIDQPWTLRQAVSRAARLQNDRQPHVTVETVFTEDEHPFDLLTDAVTYGVPRWSGFGIDLLRFADDDGSWTLAAIGTPEPGVFHLVGGIPISHRRWNKVERWIGSTHGISRCFLNHSDFEDVGNRLSSRGDVEVGRWTARLVHDRSSLSRGFPVVTGMARPSHLEAIQEAESQVASVRTLTMHVGEVLSLHLRRIAGATFYSGDFKVFEDDVLARLEVAAASRRTLVTGRARVEKQAMRPLSIRLEQPVLVTAEDTGSVIEQIESTSGVSLAVFHRNPYLHVAVTDEVDGSNFDIMVTDAQTIDVFPGFRASPSALSRISQGLGERFNALDIVDRTSDPVSLASLFGG